MTSQRSIRVITMALLLAILWPLTTPVHALPSRWKARWIWCEGEARPYHFFLFARRNFSLNEKPRSAVLHITASDRYRLFVNGNYLGRGPARCDPRWQSYDSYDLLPHLRTGKNTIAVQAYHYGCPTGFTRDARAGLFAQLEITQIDGKLQIIGTDGDWLVRPARGWRRDAQMINSAVGVTEIYNANLDPHDWMQIGFDDSSWDRPVVIADTASPWSSLEPRDIPMLREEELFPVRVVSVGEVLDLTRANMTDVPEQLAREVPEPLRIASIVRPEALLRADGVAAEISMGQDLTRDNPAAGLRVPTLILDFGRQVNGFPRIRIDGPPGAVVDMTYGQQLFAGRVLPIIGGTRYGDRYILRPGPQTWEVFEYKQFRYLQVTFRNLLEPVRVDSISVNLYTYPAPIRGRFECSNPILTKLWKACTETTLLSMDDGFMDSSWREKRNWLGDGSHALLGVYPALGDIALTDRYFRLTMRGEMGDGMLRMFFPGSDLPLAPGLTVPNVIPQHALVWAVRVWEHYRFFGKRGLLVELEPTLIRLARWFERHSNEEGLLENLPYWNWLDWSATDLRGINFSTNAFYYRFLKDLSLIERELGRAEEASWYDQAAEKLKSKLRSLLWDQQRGLYQDSYYEGRLTGVASELAQGLALLYDIAAKEQIPRILENLLRKNSGLAQVTPLFVHYVLEGLARVGRTDAAVDLMLERYGPMVQVSDTIWESWYTFAGLEPITTSGERRAGGFPDLGDNRLPRPISEYVKTQFNSLVHCGGVGASLVLSTEILGVKPAAPGFGRCLIEPRTAGLTWARGVFPSVRGDIRVDWKKDGEQFVIELEIPPGLETDLSLPYDRSQLLTHNQRQHRLLKGTAFKATPGGPQLKGEQVVLTLSGGKHRVELAPLP